MTDARDDRTGQILAGRFRLEKVLGEGGAGFVYRGVDVASGRPVAVKVLRAEVSAMPDMVKRFVREAHVAKRLDHPNIVEDLGAGQTDDGALYLAMELVEGGSLTALLDEEKRIAPERAIGLMRQVLEGLGHAHALGVVHRDVKPDNVLLQRSTSGDGSLVAKLGDFGLAADREAIEKLTRQGTAFGTPEYISPEMALGLKVDGRADLYAVGVMLFEMLAGRRPFVNHDRGALLRQHVYEALPTMASVAPDARVPSAIEAAVARALTKKPEERYPDAATMIEALDAALAAPPEADLGRGLLGTALGWLGLRR